MSESKRRSTVRERLWDIIFEAETPAGRMFDVVLLWIIGLSVLAVMMETVESVEKHWGDYLRIAEWIFTGLFTVEYVMRLWVSRRPLRYAFSFYGIVDFFSCLPAYVALFASGSSAFAVVRVLRLLRIFRVLKMVQHVEGAQMILHGLIRARAKITVFFFAILTLSVIAGTVMYYVEGGVEGTEFTNIPQSIYYAIVSITTVGYGDISAQTDLGKFLTTIMILTGYATIAVPTGIVTSELMKGDVSSEACESCGVHGHLADARYCRRCGELLELPEKEIKQPRDIE